MSALDRWTDGALARAAVYERTGDVHDLDRAIELFTRVVGKGDDAEPDRARHLDNLAVALLSRYEATGDVAALQQALDRSRAATATRHADHPDHALHLSNLCNTALVWFDECHDLAVLDDAVAAGEAAVRLGSDDEDADLYGQNCRAALVRRFEHHVARQVRHAAAFVQTGSVDDLNAAVEAGRDAIADVPDDESRGWVAWSNLSDSLRLRFEVLGADEDLTESVERGRTALHLAEHGGAPVPGQAYPPASCAVNLGAALLTRLANGGPVDDADEVIDIGRSVAAREETPEPDRLLLLSHVVGALQERAAHRPGTSAGPSDTDDAVTVSRELLAAVGPGDRGIVLSNLANSLLTRARDDGDPDVAEAIVHASAAVHELPEGTQDWARAAATFATALTRRWRATSADDDAAAAIEQRQAIAASSTVAAAVRIAAAHDTATLALAWGRPQVAAKAAGHAVAMLPLVAWWGLARHSRERRLSEWPGIGTDAAAAAVAAELPADAAVFVEHGRGVLWAQTLDARRGLGDVQRRAPEPAVRLERLRALLDARAEPSTMLGTP